MYLTIKDSISMEVLDKCQTTDWLQAVQYVELNKLTYLKDHPSLVVAIVNNQADLICHWTLTHGKRSVLLNDKMFQELKPTPAKARKSKKIKTTQVE